MSLPKIRKEFKSILKETPKAVLFQDFDKKEYWIPRSLVTLVKEKKDMVVATLAAFKFEEITGIEVEDMKKSFVSMGGTPLEIHKVEISELVESKTKPLFEVQRNVLLKHHIFCCYHALFWDAGTGKTISALTLANTSFTFGFTDVCVVLCPAHIKEQWKEAVTTAFPELPVKIFSIQSTSFEKSLEKFVEAFGKIEGRKHLIVDESHLIKNQSAKRSKNVFRYVKSDFTTICTATPIGRNAGDLYYQFAVMDKAIIGEENYGSFEKHFLLLGGSDGERVVALQNTKDLSERISPYISFLSKKDIRKNMPEKRYLKYEFELNDNQRKAIGYINGLIYQIQSRSKSGYIPKEKSYQISSFLQKIASGFVPTDDELSSVFANLGTLGEMADNIQKIKDIQYQSNNNRLLMLKKVIDEHPEPAIIWCKYIEEANEVHRALPQSRLMIGEIPLKQRWNYCKEFRQGKFKYLIASVQLGSGIDLPEINLSINYSATWDLINRKQLEERTHRIISEKDTLLIDLIARNSIDERIHQVLEYKEEIANIFNGEIK